MATKPLKTVGKKKQPSAVETSKSIEDKVKAFLKAGGEIEQVNSGVSGQQSMAQPKAKPKPAATEAVTTEPAATEAKPEATEATPPAEDNKPS